MKIRSELINRPLFLREIILKKNTSQAKTSEAYFNIDAQPPNTCPMIDHSINEVRDTVSRLISDEQDLNALREKKIDPDLTCCENASHYQRNIYQLMSALSDIASVKQKVILVEPKLEELRKACQLLRAYGTDAKDLLWKLIEPQKDLEGVSHKEAREEVISDLIKQKPTFESKTFLHKIWNVDFDCPKFNEEFCREYCSNYVLNGTLSDYFETLQKVQLIYPDSIDLAFENFNVITSWVDSLEEELYKVKIIDVTEEDIAEYLDLMNSEQKEAFTEWVKTLTPRVRQDFSEDLNAFLSESEDMIRHKELSLLLDLYNIFVVKFNQALSQEFNHDANVLAELLIEASDIRNLFYDIKEQKVKFMKGTIINLLSNFINSVQSEGLQTFIIEK